MTTTTRPEDAVRAVCDTLGLNLRGLAPLRAHATSVYHLPCEQAIVRVSPLAKYEAIANSIVLTRWLTRQGYPATEPLGLNQPVRHQNHVITLWRHYPQSERAQPTPDHLGRLLRRLHELPCPPLALPHYRPLASLRTTLEHSRHLSSEIQTWLSQTTENLLDAYQRLSFPLGLGLIHGDAYPGNTLWDGSTVRLGDWDEAAIGPRELDLANTHHGAVRFGRPQQLVDVFTHAYGYDLAAWPGSRILIAIRDFHTLGSFIRRAEAGDVNATAQLEHRLATLRAGHHTARWDIF
ncbi:MULTISPECIES: phosphotransferase [Streptomyces]|uniref:Aminoglycoside phosphotransferase family protein n=1 Tax=Streptomyces luteosporeus TaxID=173856 RepID=A0ABN3TUW3_9ACTN